MSRPLALELAIIGWPTRRQSVLFSSFCQTPHMASSCEGKQKVMGIYWGLFADLGRKRIEWELEAPWESNRLAVALRQATGEESAGSSDRDLSQPSFRP